MKTVEFKPLELDARARSMNVILHRIQAATTHPAFYHQQGLHGHVLVDYAGEVWWNDPFKGFMPMSQAHKTAIGTQAFRGLLRLFWFHIAHNFVMQPEHFPSAEDLGLHRSDWEGIKLALEVHGLVAA